MHTHVPLPVRGETRWPWREDTREHKLYYNAHSRFSLSPHSHTSWSLHTCHSFSPHSRPFLSLHSCFSLSNIGTSLPHHSRLSFFLKSCPSLLPLHMPIQTASKLPKWLWGDKNEEMRIRSMFYFTSKFFPFFKFIFVKYGFLNCMINLIVG